MKRRWLWKWEECINGSWLSNGTLFDTRREAVNCLADVSLRRYERTGNFNHDQYLRIRRVAA